MLNAYALSGFRKNFKKSAQERVFLYEETGLIVYFTCTRMHKHCIFKVACYALTVNITS